MKTVTTDTTLEFSVSEDSDLEANFGLDAEYYEQHGITWVVSFEGGMEEAFPIIRVNGKLTTAGTPEHDFDWESAEEFRGGPFPS